MRENRSLTSLVTCRQPRPAKPVNTMDVALAVMAGKPLPYYMFWQRGAPVSELLAIRVEDIDFGSRTLRTRKNYQERFLLLKIESVGQIAYRRQR